MSNKVPGELKHGFLCNSAKAALDLYKRYLVVAAPFVGSTPKAHLLLHVPSRAALQGSPWAHATWVDEGLNKRLKQVLRLCHQVNFEAAAFSRMADVLRRDATKRRRPE